MDRRRIYIAGPMTGYENYNFAAFDGAAAQLKLRGWLVINPADLDRVHWGFKEYPPKDIIPRWYPDKKALVKSCIRRDVNALLEFEDGDALFLLKGWEQSPGANGEAGIVNWLRTAFNIEIFYEEDGYPEA